MPQSGQQRSLAQEALDGLRAELSRGAQTQEPAAGPSLAQAALAGLRAQLAQSPSLTPSGAPSLFGAEEHGRVPQVHSARETVAQARPSPSHDRERSLLARDREVQRLSQTPAEPSLGEKVSSAGTDAWSGLIGAVLDLPEYVGRGAQIAAREVERPKGPTVRGRRDYSRPSAPQAPSEAAQGTADWLRGSGDFLRALSQEAKRDLPVPDPRVADSFVFGTLPRAGGQVLGTVAAGVAGGGAGALASGIATNSNALMEQVERELAPKVTAGEMTKDEAEDRAITAWASGLGLGLLDAIPVMGILRRADKATGGGVKRAIKDVAKGAASEAATEAVQTGGEQGTVAWLTDDERSLLERLGQGQAGEIGEAAGAGGVIGGVLTMALLGAKGAARAATRGRAGRDAAPTAVESSEPVVQPEPAQAVVEPEGEIPGLLPSGVAGPIEVTEPQIAGPVEQVQIVPEAESAPAAVDAGPAVMPTEAGLFGEIERESAPAAGPAVGQAAAPTASMFDEQPGDLPGQTSLLDAAADVPFDIPPEAPAAPTSPQRTRSQAAEIAAETRRRNLETKALAGEGTLRDFIAAQGGLQYSPEGWGRFSKKEGGEKRPVGQRYPVRPEGQGGLTTQQAAIAASEAGFFPGVDSRDIGLNELLDAMESDVTPHNADRIAQQVQEDYFREQAEMEAYYAEHRDEIVENDLWASPRSNPTSARTVPPPDPAGLSRARPQAPSLKGAAVVPAPPHQPGRPISAPQVQEAMAQVIEAAGNSVPFRIGRLGPAGRTAAGLFKVGPGVIRIREAYDLPTAAHEMAHALEKALFGFKGNPWTADRIGRSAQKELQALGFALYGGTKPQGGYRREGWAEFVRLWITDQPAARKKAPNFARWMEATLLPQNTEVATALRLAVNAMRQWQSQGALARAEASIVDLTSPRERAKSAIAWTKRALSKWAWIDMGEPIREFSEKAQENMGAKLPNSRDPWVLYDGLRGTHDTRANRMVEEAMIDLAGNRVGPSLAQALAPVRGKRREFTLYLWGRQAQLYWNDPTNPEGRNPGLSREDADSVVDELRSPAFQVAEGMLREWHDSVLNYAAQASPAFRQVVERVRESHPGYLMPLQRAFEEADSLWQRAARRRTGQATSRSPVQAMRGSGRRIKEPFQAMASNARAIVLKAHQRAVLDAVIALSRVEGMGGLVEKVPHDQAPVAARPIRDLIAQIKRKLGDEADVNVDAVPGADLDTLLGETLTFFAPTQHVPGQDPILPYWNGSSVDWYQVDHGLYDTLAGMDVYRLPAIADWTLGVFARTLRMGATGLSPAFGLITNPQLDLPSLWLNTQSSKTGIQLFGSWLHQTTRAGLAAATAGKIPNTPEMEKYLDLGGAISQSLGQDTQHTKRAARRLFEGPVMRTLDARNWFDLMREVMQFPESSARSVEVGNVLRDAGWKPGDPLDLDLSLDVLRAGKKVTTDFFAAGAYGRVFNQITAFFNASIQGPRAHLRAARHHPGRFMFRLSQVTAATLALWWATKDEEWYEELPPEERFGYWHFKVGNEVLRLRRPFEIGGFFAALPEALADAAYRSEPEKFKEWFGEMFDAITPPLMPTGAEIVLEQASNEDFYTGAPIVPRGQEDMPPEEQFGEYTSRAAKALGDTFKVSPRRIDHAIRGAFAGLGEDVLSLVGLGPEPTKRGLEPADTPVIGRLFLRGGTTPQRTRSVDDLWARFEEYTLRQRSKRQEETPEQRQMRLQLSDATKAITALSYVRQHTESPLQRRRINAEIAQIAKDALEAEKAGKAERWNFTNLRKQAEGRQERIEGSRQ